jgi:thioesterase domain-containing protein
VVIQTGATDYLLPIVGAFTATCRQPDEAVWERFLRMLERHGRGRIELTASVVADGELVATFQGRYVAIGGQPEEV